MDLTVKFEGLDLLQKAFDLLPQKVGVKAASKSVKAGAKIMLNAARANVPVDTGNLKRSIAVKVLNKKRDAMEVVALVGATTKYRRANTKTKQKYNDKVKDGFYGRFLEYGTKYMPAQPWLRPAYDENQKAAVQAILNIVGEAITTEAQQFYFGR